LFCQDKDQVSLVISTSASFVSTNVLNATCLSQPSLILNSSNTLTSNLCNYCFDKNPCSITNQVIDDNGMFNDDTYQTALNYSPIPISVGIFYICVDQTQIEMFNQASLCTDTSLLYKTPTFTSTSTSNQSTSTTTTISYSSTPSSSTTTISSSLTAEYVTVKPTPTLSDSNFHLEVGVICIKSDFFSIHQKKDKVYFTLIPLFINYFLILII